MPKGKGAKMQVTITTQSSGANFYNRIELWGANYSCANEKGNAFVHTSILSHYLSFFFLYFIDLYIYLFLIM